MTQLNVFFIHWPIIIYFGTLSPNHLSLKANTYCWSMKTLYLTLIVNYLIAKHKIPKQQKIFFYWHTLFIVLKLFQNWWSLSTDDHEYWKHGMNHWILNETFHSKHLTHYTMQTAERTMQTVHCTLQKAHWSLKTENCTMNTSHCTLNSAHCIVHNSHCSANCRLHSEHFPLHSGHCSVKLPAETEASLPEKSMKFQPGILYWASEKVKRGK